MSIDLNKIILVVTAFLLAIALSTRGVLGIWSDIFILTMTLFISKRVVDLKLNKTLIMLFATLIILYLLSSLINQVYDLAFIYYISIIIPFILILKKRNTVFYFIISWGLINSLIVALTLLTMFGLFDLQGIIYSREGGFRAAGLITNPNYYAYMNFISFILCAQIVFKYKKIVMTLLFMGVVLSFSRGVIGGLLIFITLNYSTFNRVTLITVAFLVLSSFSFVAYDFLPEGVLKTLEYRLEDSSSGNLSGRGEIWSLGFDHWSTSYKYILFGFGFNNFQNTTGLSNTVHNAYFRTIFEQGIVAFIAMMAFYLYGILNTSIKVLKINNKIIILISILFTWLSNDYHLVKETMILIAVMSVLFKSNFLVANALNR